MCSQVKAGGQKTDLAHFYLALEIADGISVPFKFEAHDLASIITTLQDLQGYMNGLRLQMN
jgi:hypothetical protein